MRIRLGPEDDGRELHAQVGDILVVELPENPTTGVRWAASQAPGLLELTSDSYVAPEIGEESGPERPGVGASAVRVLEFSLRSSGRADLLLKRLKEWEGDSTIDATFRTKIQIGE